MLHLTDTEFETLSKFVEAKYGLNLQNQRLFAETRLQSLLSDYNLSDFSEFYRSMICDPTGDAVSDLINALTVNYSLFYRDKIHFHYLRDTVLPALVQRNGVSRDLRIWSAGCATGEEPYTIAMILSDFFGLGKADWDTTILATDVSTTALRKAIVGSYNETSTCNLDPAWLLRYFMPDREDDRCVRVVDSIRKEVLFCEHNLLTSPFLFKRKFHLIFCRNVMLYFDRKTTARVLRRLYDVLEDGGYLFIGLSESIAQSQVPFEYVIPSVYRKGRTSR